MASSSGTRNSTGLAQVGPNGRTITSTQVTSNAQLRKRPSRQSLPDASTALASFTSGRVFPSEQKLLGSINWNAVASKPLFDDPPIFQTLRIFLFSPRSSPFLTPTLKQAINTDAHISHLERCWDILKKGQKEDLQKTFGMPEKVGEMRFEIYRLWIMEKLAWRIVQALKNAVDRSRISEVGEYALYVVDMNKKVAPRKFDPLPLLTLACSLTYPHPSVSLHSNTRDTITPLSRADRDKTALEYFQEGFKSPNNRIRDLPSNVYAKAHYSRLLRRLGREKDADNTEEEIMEWWAVSGSLRMKWDRLSSLICAAGEPSGDNPILKKLENVPKAIPRGAAIREPNGETGAVNLKMMSSDAARRRYSPNSHLSPYSTSNARPNLTPPEKDPRRGRVSVPEGPELQIPRATSPALDNLYPRSTSPHPRAPVRSSSPNPHAPPAMGSAGSGGVRYPSPNPRAPSPMGIRGMRSPSPNLRAPSPMGTRNREVPSPAGARNNGVISSIALTASSPELGRLFESSSSGPLPKQRAINEPQKHPSGGPRSPVDKPLPVAPSMNGSRPPLVPLPLALRSASDSSQNDNTSASSLSPTESRSATNRSTPNTSPSSSTCADDHPPVNNASSESKWSRKFWKRGDH